MISTFSRQLERLLLPTKFLIGLFVVAVVFSNTGIAQAATTVDLGTADSFAILAGTAVTDVPASVITGDVGLSPAAGTNYAGLTSSEVSGTIYAVDSTGPDGSAGNNPSLLTSAKNDLTTAYLDAAGRTPGTSYGAVDNTFGGKTLTSGVYAFGHAATANLTGTLTLDAQSDPNAVFIFQASSDLVTASSSVVTLVNGAQACNVFWQVTSSATLGTSSTFVGTIMALTSIGLNTNATMQGRALARNAAVTLDHNTITKPTCAAATATPTASTSTSTTTSSSPSSSVAAEATSIASTSTSASAAPDLPNTGFGLPVSRVPLLVGLLILLAALGSVFWKRKQLFPHHYLPKETDTKTPPDQV